MNIYEVLTLRPQLIELKKGHKFMHENQWVIVAGHSHYLLDSILPSCGSRPIEAKLPSVGCLKTPDSQERWSGHRCPDNQGPVHCKKL